MQGGGIKIGCLLYVHLPATMLEDPHGHGKPGSVWRSGTMLPERVLVVYLN